MQADRPAYAMVFCRQRRSLAKAGAIILSSIAMLLTMTGRGFAADQDPQSERTTVVVALGGNATCQTGPGPFAVPSRSGLPEILNKSLEETRQSLGSNRVKYVSTCLTLYPEIGAFETDLDLAGTRQKIHYKTMLENLAKHINALPNPRVVLMGFSYGGWMTFKLLPMLAEHVTVKGLLTIDPISKDRCGMMHILKSAGDNIPFKGCLEAPTDLSPEELDIAAHRPESWVNVYQDQGLFLHSGPLPGAQNLLKNLPDLKLRTVWPHLVLTHDSALQAELAQMVAERALVN